MFLTFIGLLIGMVCGVAIGAISFALAENFFGRGIGILVKSPVLAAILGAVFMGVPSLVVGAIVGGFRLNRIQSVIAGLVVGLLMVLLFVVRNESKYFYENGYFDKQVFYYDLIINATWLLGLCLVAVIVSAAVRELFAQSR